MRNIRVGNGCGFWGDNIDAPVRLAESGRLDYLTLEYLAELTMSILAIQKQKDPQAGFAKDFLDVLPRLCPILQAQPQLKIVTNAGGMNPLACGKLARQILDKAGLTDRKLAVVSGDDLLPHVDRLLSQSHDLAHLDTGKPLSTIRDRLVSANAYLGAAPIVQALQNGASIVITGRVADASLTVAPAVHAFDWRWDDWNRLAAATVAGHLIECGAQVTGGLWCNWEEVKDWAHLGYPIAVIEADGNLAITKPEGSGGVVNRETVAEQLLYEVGDPAAYLTPDVVADFKSVQLNEVSKDCVAVTGARGEPATPTYKVSCAYRNGYTASGILVIAGPQATAKARLCGDLIWQRLRAAGFSYDHSNAELLGTGACAGGIVDAPDDLPEVVLRVSVADQRKDAVERFTRELAPLVTSGPPGVTGYTSGRPIVREVFAYWPTLLDVRELAPTVQFL